MSGTAGRNIKLPTTLFCVLQRTASRQQHVYRLKKLFFIYPVFTSHARTHNKEWVSEAKIFIIFNFRLSGARWIKRSFFGRRRRSGLGNRTVAACSSDHLPQVLGETAQKRAGKGWGVASPDPKDRKWGYHYTDRDGVYATWDTYSPAEGGGPVTLLAGPDFFKTRL